MMEQQVVLVFIHIHAPNQGDVEMKKSQNMVVGTRQRVGEYFVDQNSMNLMASPYFQHP